MTAAASLQPMKTILPQALLFDQLAQLHLMEIHIARELPILAGSVLDTELRRLLSARAKCARERRDSVEELLGHHDHLSAVKTLDSIRGILAEGNKDLSAIRNPRSRDVAMVEHCIRIEQHATAAYGIAVPLINRIGFSGIGDRLKLSLSDLEKARPAFRSIERKLFIVAGVQPPFAVEKNPSPVNEWNQCVPAGEEFLDVAC
jgi:ferritin-like metal-binding protein YciE